LAEDGQTIGRANEDRRKETGPRIPRPAANNLAEIQAAPGLGDIPFGGALRQLSVIKKEGGQRTRLLVSEQVSGGEKMGGRLMGEHIACYRYCPAWRGGDSKGRDGKTEDVSSVERGKGVGAQRLIIGAKKARKKITCPVQKGLLGEGDERPSNVEDMGNILARCWGGAPRKSGGWHAHKKKKDATKPQALQKKNSHRVKRSRKRANQGGSALEKTSERQRSHVGYLAHEERMGVEKTLLLAG